MPFIGKDWRSPGDQWVKVSEGWEKTRLWRLKMFGNLNENTVSRIIRLAQQYDAHKPNKHSSQLQYHHEHPPDPQPHIHLLKGLSREQQIQTCIGEALNKLDMSRAVRDIKRFDYVCKLVMILVKEKLHHLSGAAQKAVFNILESISNTVITSQMNPQVLSDLLLAVEKGLEKARYYHIGSSILWQSHLNSVQKMKSSLEALKVTEREDDGGLHLHELPDEIIFHILRCLSDHMDIVSTGLTRRRLYNMATEELLWRELCFYNFSNTQIQRVVSSMTKDDPVLNWKEAYRRLNRGCNKRENYTDMICLCSNCRALYWKCQGHPCFDKENPPHSQPISPEKFISLFRF